MSAKKKPAKSKSGKAKSKHSGHNKKRGGGKPPKPSGSAPLAAAASPNLSPTSGRPVPRTVTWLHVSDFHFREKDTFDRSEVQSKLCDLVQTYRTQKRFAPELIFATGDIAQSGEEAEYKNASKFFDQLLKAADLPKERLFVAPGNHDVHRPSAVDLTRALNTQEDSDKYFSRDPKTVRHLDKLASFGKWYAKYFGARDVDPFSLCRTPRWLSINGLRVGVLTLSTALFSLDDHDFGKLWLGRDWLAKALKKLQSKKPELSVALMHHPLDWLHDEERSQIRASLYEHCDVLLRGHLHETEAEATITPKGVVHLAAGAAYQGYKWPRRAMFVRANADDGTLLVHPIAYQEAAVRAWTLDPSVFPHEQPSYEIVLPLRLRHLAGTGDTRQMWKTRVASKVERHSRVWNVNRNNGLAHVAVELTDARVQGDLVLAVPAQPHCRVLAEPLLADGSTLTVNEHPLEVETRFMLAGSGQYSRVDWKYWLSNGLPLSQADGIQMPKAQALPDGVFGRPHVVRFPCGHLSLAYDFGDGDIAGNVAPRVEHWDDTPGQEAWIEDEEATKQCRVNTSSTRPSLEVDNPLVGYRYTLCFQPKQRGRLLEEDDIRAIDEIRGRCRAERRESPLVAMLTEALSKALEAEFGSIPATTSCVAFLWARDRKILLPSFGLFPNQGWSTRFAFGNGVAGHAFRFARVAAWAGDQNHHSTIFSQRTDEGGPFAKTYKWVVSVPLVVDASGPSAGVISIASDSVNGDFEESMFRFAQDAAATDGSRTEAVAQVVSTIITAVNRGVWDAIQHAGNDLVSDHAKARAARAVLAIGTSSASHPPSSTASLPPSSGPISGH